MTQMVTTAEISSANITNSVTVFIDMSAVIFIVPYFLFNAAAFTLYLCMTPIFVSAVVAVFKVVRFRNINID